MSKLTPLKVLNKPDSGEACNGCGYCCHEEACLISQELLHSSLAPCIALEWDGERFNCGMSIRPAHYLGITFEEANVVLVPMVHRLLGIGKGCDSDIP